MLVERNVYQRILPSLRLPSLHYYGFVDEEESDLSWLFIEAADGMPFSAESHLHRRKAAEWLGGMHTATAQQELRSFLPSYELDDHLRDVNFARKNILQSRLNPALSKSEFLILDATLAHCDWLESRRGELQDFSARMPRCLVHGDFDNKNVRVRTQDGSFVLEIMDWETASWSFPAVDIATIDLSTYFRIVQPYWPNLTIEAVRDLAAIGSIFINMGFIAATSPELIQEWAPYTVQDIAIFEQILTNSRRALGWG